MGKVRLQINILPLQDQHSAQSKNAARQSETRPWTQPENSENTLAQLVDHIVERYGRIYVGRGPLKIKELQDSWGSTLDLADKIGDVFDDRTSSGDIFTSICKVLRYPSDPVELQNAQRFVSLAPESSARPQKRPPPPLFNDANRVLPSVETFAGIALDGDTGPSHKRQKIHHEHAHDQRRSQQPGSRNSLLQVLDSQPSQTHANAYGTPTSPSNRRHQPVQQDDNHTVPDSPVIGNSSVRNEDRETKSESPVLRLSVHDIPPHVDLQSQQESQPPDASSRHASLPHTEHDDANDRVPKPIAPDVSPDPDHAVNRGGSDQSQMQPLQYPEAQSGEKLVSPQAVMPNGQKPTSSKDREQEVYDPIESDSDGFDRRQQLFSAKQHRISKTPSRMAALPLTMSNSSKALKSMRNPSSSSTQPSSKAFNGDKQEQSTSASRQSGQNQGDHLMKVLVAGAEGCNQPTRPQDPKQMASNLQRNDLLNPSAHPSGATDVQRSIASERAHQEVAPNAGERVAQALIATQPESLNEKKAQLSMRSDMAIPTRSSANNLEAKSSVSVIVRPKGTTSMAPKDQITGSRINTTVGEPSKASAQKALSQGFKAVNITNGAHKLQLPVLANDEHGDSNMRDTNKGNSNFEQHKQLKSTLPPLQSKAQPRLIANRPSDDFTVAATDYGAFNELQLQEDGERAMLASDGAKQLEIERSNRKPASATPKANGWLNKPDPKPAKPPPVNAAQRKAQERRERDEAYIQKWREHNFRNGVLICSSQGSHSEQLNVSNDQRHTLTPIVPITKAGRSSSPYSTKSSMAMGPPPRSALKQPSSSLRKSISQVSFSINQESSTANAAPQTNGATETGRKSTPTTTTSSKASKKVQSTLNDMFIDKKMKGRAINSPSPIKPIGPEIISSGESVSEYTITSEEGIDPTIAKAGPSKKKKLIIRSASRRKLRSGSPTTQVSSSIDPALQALNHTKSSSLQSSSTGISAPIENTSSKDHSSATNETVNEAIEISSRSESDSESEDDSESGSESDVTSKPTTVKQATGGAIANDPPSSSWTSGSTPASSGVSSEGIMPAANGTKLPKPAQGQSHTPLQNTPSNTTQGITGIQTVTARATTTRPNFYPKLSELRMAREDQDEEQPPTSAQPPRQKSPSAILRNLSRTRADEESEDDDEDETTSEAQVPPEQSQSRFAKSINDIRKTLFYLR
ncbi:uncharacterized protein KY384_009012 [Bacidia gigantensis]|uniref:uncharacterized protein n=1 Tax=Bacidia gigantensis TaxID=2732470 RepID=UPI001D049D5E|nr:uncharacterized protein KY384_009012 [Bacidia gigantensis]KAG8525368.1 hypothetical protein KY384_009012 [Bacidia gigantensis]